MMPPSMGAGPPSGPGYPVPTVGWPLCRMCTTSPNPAIYPLTPRCQSIEWTVESATVRVWSLRDHPVTYPTLHASRTASTESDDRGRPRPRPALQSSPTTVVAYPGPVQILYRVMQAARLWLWLRVYGFMCGGWLCPSRHRERQDQEYIVMSNKNI